MNSTIRRLLSVALAFAVIGAAGAGMVLAQEDRSDSGPTAQPTDTAPQPSVGAPSSDWDPEEQLIVDSFLTQPRAIDADDLPLFLTVTTATVSIHGNPVPAEQVFAVLKKLALEDPADYQEAYNPGRIVDIRVHGDSADFDFRDTKTDAIQNFKFTIEDGLWKWSGLN